MNRAAGLALGTVQWGLAYGIANRSGQPTVEVVQEMLTLARPSISLLDTARAYGDSERVLGETTACDPHWGVVTKLAPDADTPERAAASLAASRQALRRDVLYAVLLHRWAQRSSVWDVLRRERDAGRVGYIGASALDPEEAWQMLADPEVQVIQVATSLFDQRLSREGFFERAAAAEKTVFVRSVFLQGAGLLPLDRLPSHLNLLAEPTSDIWRWAAVRGVSAAVPFLAFAAALSGVSVLLGCESVSQLASNLRDWAIATAATDEIGPLAASMPNLANWILNPAQWPKS